MKHIHYLLLSVLLAFSSCQNNEETVIENNFKGHTRLPPWNQTNLLT